MHLWFSNFYLHIMHLICWPSFRVKITPFSAFIFSILFWFEYFCIAHIRYIYIINTPLFWLDLNENLFRRRWTTFQTNKNGEKKKIEKNGKKSASDLRPFTAPISMYWFYYDCCWFDYPFDTVCAMWYDSGGGGVYVHWPTIFFSFGHTDRKSSIWIGFGHQFGSIYKYALKCV